MRLKIFVLLAFVLLPFYKASTAFANEPSNSIENHFIPPYEKFDWIKLVSDEWLKGDIKEMYDDKFEFESDELDTLYFDWEDVKEIYSSRQHMVGIVRQLDAVGTIVLKDATLTIITKDGEFKIEKENVLSLIQGGKKRSSLWTGKINLGLDISKGNNEEKDINANMTVSRRTTDTRITLSYLGNFSETNDIETTNDHRVNFNWDIYQNKQFFWRPLFGEYYQDPFSNIKSKKSLGIGVGYTFIDTSKLEWNVSGGPSYLETNYESVEIGEDLRETSTVLTSTTNVDWEINDDTDFLVLYQLQWGKEESGGYTHHFVATFEFDIGSDIDLSLSTIWDYTDNIKANEDGTLPVNSDLNFVVGLGMDF